MEAKTQLLIPPKNEETGVRDEHFHVLAVDDSVIERKMLEKLLTISSYHVTCVESGDKALEFLGLGNCHSSVVNSDDLNNHEHDDGDDHNDDNADGSHGHDDDDDNTMICHSLESLPLPKVNNVHQEQEITQGQGTRVNLIMTDYSMPGMSGYDLLKRVKESSWKDVPVVVMSSENVPSRIHMCLEEGAEEFLLKPVRLSDLKKLQPRILKPTSSSTTNTTTCHYYCESSDNKGNLFEANDIDKKISKEEIKVGDNHEDYTSNSYEENDEEKIKFKDEMVQFAKISKLDQLVI